ncbi:MAG: glycosyltransferase [Bacteroidia bacterium]
MKLSVIIVNYNVKYFLEQALYSVRRAGKRMTEAGLGEYEVYVVDNNSVDGSAEMVRHKFPEVKLIVNEKNAGFSAANNQAISLSKAEYILLLNPDTVVEEDTFTKCVSFMDDYPMAGGLGVKMLDGKGRFLPESKRAFPTPSVAFYKMSGLSSLFPKSRVFGRYHLGYLSPEEVHEVDVLAGAFMLMRKSVLDEIGLLDETFFMYGEDIDLSYRIKKGGYKNYYYPKTRIIHYKGESTRKSSVNYVFIFYNAMVIFAKKHFSSGQAKMFSFLINIAIYLRATASVIARIIKTLALPATDAAMIFGGLLLLKNYWESTVKYIDGGEYPVELVYYSFPAYTLIWILTNALSGSYQRPYSLRKLVKGVVAGTILISVIYAFLPESFRYSRALIILGAAIAAVIMMFNRLLLHLVRERNLDFGEPREKRVAIVGNPQEANRVLALLEKTRVNFNLTGFVATEESYENETNFVGSIRQLNEIAEVYQVNEIIFCSKDVSSREIIHWMTTISKANVNYKIVPEESLFIIGSNSKHAQGDLYTIQLHLALSRPDVRFRKRLMDLGITLFLFVASPVLIWRIKDKGGYFRNIIQVLSAKKSWVGYVPVEQKESLPKIPRGILTPQDRYAYRKMGLPMLERLNFLYARDYRIEQDIEIVWNGLRHLGRQQLKLFYDERDRSYSQGSESNRTLQSSS